MENVTYRMTVLAVDDEPLNQTLIQSLLEPCGFEVVKAADSAAAQALMAVQTFDLLLIDIMLPDLDGLELTRWARKDARHKDIPILMLTSLTGKQTLMKAFEAGAVDYVTKPFHGPELIYRVRAQLKQREVQRRMEDYANELNLQVLRALRAQQEMEQIQGALAEANKSLAEWAHKDALTGLWNRRKAWDLMEYEAHRSHRKARTIGVAMIDLDKFKSVNDLLGHDTGDEVLKKASALLAGTLRQGDILVRWGGEEFLAVFPETDLDGSRAAAEKLRTAVAGGAWDLPDRPGVTISVGVALKTTSDEWDEVLKAADAALYRAKEGGRNQVCVHESANVH